jgi:hypothetical protein
MYIQDVKMVGDNMHNKSIDLLLSGIDKRTKLYKTIYPKVEKIFNESTHRWIGLTMGDIHLRKLNSIMKSKTNKTYIKRVKSLLDTITNTRYGHLMHRNLLKLIDEIYEINV